MIEATHTTSDWRSLWILNYVFDGSYFDVFAVLGSGGTVCIARKTILVTDMTACINKMRCTHIFITPSIAGAFQPQEMPQLTVLIVGGEAPHAALRDVWAPRMKVYSAYGPTECAIFVTVKLITPAESRLTTLGERTKHAELSIRALDSANLVTEGKIGELCIGGAQVGGGYLTRPDLTAAAFTTFDSGGRIYRSGDLAWRLEDGQIELLGRKDEQVKINGYRIELGEIENAILLTGIVMACVVVVANIQGKKQLVACCLFPGQDRSSIQPEQGPIMPPVKRLPFDEIRAKLETVPGWMMPTLWVPLALIPISASGKIDRKRLVTTMEAMKSGLITRYQECLTDRANLQW